MDLLLIGVGAFTVFNLMKKEGFQETSNFHQTEGQKKGIVWGNQQVTSAYNQNEEYYNLGNEQPMDQAEWIKKNSIYNNKTIHGIPLKDYYDTYSKSVYEKGEWFLNQNMPQETKQYEDDSAIQSRMEQFTGLKQQREREALGKPHRTETLALFTPEEQTTGFGYQFGNNGGGPGAVLTRQKEIENFKKTIRLKTNEMPFEKVQVGPGLAIGADVAATGGFHPFTRVMPENIGDYKANQLAGRVTGGKWIYSNAPTSQAPVMKNRPNTFYENKIRGPGPGRSTITAETLRPEYLLKNQNRSMINSGFGAPLQSFLN
jgi:hypothetical protein